MHGVGFIKGLLSTTGETYEWTRISHRKVGHLLRFVDKKWIDRLIGGFP